MNLPNKNIMTIALLTSLSSMTSAETKLTGPYLGQKAPGLTAEVFAPNIISTKDWESGVVFAPNMKEMYMLREVNADTKPEQQFVVYEKDGENWNERVISKRVGTPTLSPNNKIMFFGRGYKERTQDGWSEMKRLGPDFESYRIMRVTSSLNGTIAFDEASNNGNGVLRYSTMKHGKLSTPKPFPKEINTGIWNAHPFIAPDESYVIWDGQRGEDTRNSDLFISFKEPDESWGEAIKFGDNVNTSENEFAAQLSPDGKYLFFNRNGDDRNVDTYWVDAKVIEDLKPAHIKKYLAKLGPLPTAEQASGSLWDIPVLTKAYTNTKPISSDNSLITGKLPLSKDKATAIINLAKEIGEGKHGKYDSLLIAKNNKLVFESYHQRGRFGLAHGQASATKGYTSLIVGRAIQLGYLSIADLHKPLISFLKEIDTSKLVAGADKITLHKALTMQGGLTIDRDKWQAIEKAPEQLKGQKLVQRLLQESAAITKETQSYKYGNFNPMLVMTVIDAVVPGGAEAFIKTEILDKLNISNYKWDTHVSGLPQAGWMVRLTSRDMLKLGSIVVNNGKWQEEQFISPAYLNKATSNIIKPTEDWMPDEYRYGYYWYSMPVVVEGKTYDLNVAWGGGGNRVIVVEELNLVIAITGHDREDTIMKQISDVVIPAFVS
ncbi:serine hydrolase [Pseudoalteromonas sp. MMG024]|uniref:serine hydrolase domain-containing protein n=1 Tax=Pseudoalteromonas sp. MMG024 TaxID=2909980 RepID=UPI001F185DBB|nr:serine hydrolase [Pseudoalteromonas sp. MMG024]MCF6459223.1 serine hydrolase [Pseudoalteromonas sp. MMG024]